MEGIEACDDKHESLGLRSESLELFTPILQEPYAPLPSQAKAELQGDKSWVEVLALRSKQLAKPKKAPEANNNFYGVRLSISCAVLSPGLTFHFSH